MCVCVCVRACVCACVCVCVCVCGGGGFLSLVKEVLVFWSGYWQYGPYRF